MARICGVVLAAVGFGRLGQAVVAAIGDYRNLGNLETLRSIALPIPLSVLFVPFLYATVMLSTYERVFVFLRLGPEKPREVTRYAKRRIIGRFGLHLRALTKFSQKHAARLRHVRSKSDVDAAIASC